MLAHHHPQSRSPVASPLQIQDAFHHLVEVQRLLQDCPEIRACYRRVLDHLGQIPEISRIAIAEVKRDPQGQRLQPCESQWWVENISSRRRRRNRQGNPPTQTIPQRWLQVLEQADQLTVTLTSLPIQERHYLSQQGIFSGLLVPLKVNQTLYGVIQVENSSTDRPWHPSEISLFQGVATALSMRLETLIAQAQADSAVQSQTCQIQEECWTTISHELRSPMANIQMVTQLLEIHLNQEGLLTQPNSKIPQYLQMLRDECDRKTHIINDLLDLARLESDAGETLAPTDLDLALWLPYLTEAFGDRMAQQQQQFQLHLPPDLPTLHTDVRQLERILTELLHNACKYTPAQQTIRLAVQKVPVDSIQGSDRLHPSQDCSLNGSSDSSFVDSLDVSLNSSLDGSLSGSHHQSYALQLTLTNTGVEIAEHHLQRVFDKFYRIPDLDIWKQGGTGLGLPLVKKLTQLLGATIAISSDSHQVRVCLQILIENPT
ncbi:MAG: HAMP domain-containing histidine kinase [Oculatellaceae cyanobacterium Prado106]|nr:HAMP domain-containing histidine kinase [Oculatellaceae cyanobacterium Prado106]